MMQMNRGRSASSIVFQYLLMLLIVSVSIEAKVSVEVADTFYKNERLIISIVATGEKIEYPEILEIDGNVVENAGTQQQTTIINGKREQRIVKMYAVRSAADIHIPAFTLMIDNQKYTTKPKTVQMLKVEKTQSDLYDLTITTDKKELYVGESLLFTLQFKYKKGLDIVGLDFAKPTFENFWLKELAPKKAKQSNSEYIEQEIQYLLFPQKAGKVFIDPLKIGVSTVKQGYGGGFYFSKPTVTTPVYSNSLLLDIKPLPDNVTLIGDFKINATVDTKSLRQGEAVSYKLFIEGRGNIDDLEEIALEIDNTTIYDNPAEKKYDIVNALYGGSYEKTYSIVAQENFTIPPVRLGYFDKQSQTVQTIQTKSFDIEVQGTAPQKKELEVADPAALSTTPALQNQVGIEKQKSSFEERAFFFLLGVLFAFMFIGGYLFIKKGRKSKKESTLIQTVKKASSSEELFKILCIYIGKDAQLDEVIYTLESFSQKNLKAYKKDLLVLLEKLEKKERLSNL